MMKMVMMCENHCVTRQSDSDTTEEFFPCTQYTVYSSPHISDRYNVQDTDSEHDILGRPAGSHTSQLGFIAVSRASDKTGYFIQ